VATWPHAEGDDVVQGGTPAQHTISSVDWAVDAGLVVDADCRLSQRAVKGQGVTRRTAGTVGCVGTQNTVGAAGQVVNRHIGGHGGWHTDGHGRRLDNLRFENWQLWENPRLKDRELRNQQLKNLHLEN
jgi:hypothetical protein